MGQENNKRTSEPDSPHSYGCVEKVRVDKNRMPNRFDRLPMIVNFLVILFFVTGIYAIYDIFVADIFTANTSTSNKKIIGQWKGDNYSGVLYSFLLVEDGSAYRLEGNSINGNQSYHCTKYSIKKPSDFYFCDLDKGDIQNNGVFTLNKGKTVYIIDNFDYDPIEQKEMKAILIIWERNDARIYSDYMVNGTEFYLNDSIDLPVYECYAKLH